MGGLLRGWNPREITEAWEEQFDLWLRRSKRAPHAYTYTEDDRVEDMEKLHQSRRAIIVGHECPECGEVSTEHEDNGAKDVNDLSFCCKNDECGLSWESGMYFS